MDDKALLAAVSVFALLVVLSKLKSLLVTKPKLNLPPGPWTLPVIGSLHHLVTNPIIHRAMRTLAQKHGPLMTLRLGEVQAMVVSSPEAAKEITKTHDITFADRHMNATMTTFTFNGNDIAFAPYGERWRQLRKICVLELLSAARVQSFQHIREEEVARLMQNLAASAGAGGAVNLTQMIARFINDTFVRESVGSRSKYRDEYIDTLDTAMRQTSGLNVPDLFPSSKIMQILSTAPRKALVYRNRIQRIVEQIIHDAKEAMDHGSGEAAAGTGTTTEGFVGVLLRLQKERSTPIPLDNDTIVAVLCVSLKSAFSTSSDHPLIA
jgi:hypothetical protein